MAWTDRDEESYDAVMSSASDYSGQNSSFNWEASIVS